MTQTDIHILNLGAGVQSSFEFMRSCLGLSVKYDYAIFADTQEEPGAEHRRVGLPDPPPSESVYAHLNWLISFSKLWSGPEVIITTVGRLGDDLENGVGVGGYNQFATESRGRFASIPAFTTDNNGVDVGRTRRQCSKEYKTEAIEKAIRREILELLPRKRIPKNVTIHQSFGISLDEKSRASRIYERFITEKNPVNWQVHFPLLEGQWSRANCEIWLESHCPHKVPRSACVFCPFHDDAEWQALKDKGGLDWQRIVHIDHMLRADTSRVNQEMEQVMYLHRSCVPIDEVVFKPRINTKKQQLGFAVECEGVCGI